MGRRPGAAMPSPHAPSAALRSRSPGSSVIIPVACLLPSARRYAAFRRARVMLALCSRRAGAAWLIVPLGAARPPPRRPCGCLSGGWHACCRHRASVSSAPRRALRRHVASPHALPDVGAMRGVMLAQRGRDEPSCWIGQRAGHCPPCW